MAKRQNKDVETTFKRKFKSKKKIEHVSEVKRLTRNGNKVIIEDHSDKKKQTEMQKVDHYDSTLKNMLGKQVEREEMDMILSQAEPVYEVGWKSLSPGQRQGLISQNTEDIADIVKNLMTDEELLHPPSTPPLLNVWLEDKNDDPVVRRKGLPNARPQKRSRTFGKKLTCDSKQLLEKLALAINASKDVEENSKESNRLNEKSMIEKEKTKSNDENDSLKKDGSFDLFETQSARTDKEMVSDVHKPATNTDKSVTVVYKEEIKSENKEERMDISNDDLWSDDDFLNDSLVIKATQEPSKIISIFSPKVFKRKNCTSTPDNCMKKSGRCAFSLSPVSHNALSEANGTRQSKGVSIQKTVQTGFNVDVKQTVPQKNKVGRNLMKPPCVPLFQETTNVHTSVQTTVSSAQSTSSSTITKPTLQRSTIGQLSKPLEDNLYHKESQSANKSAKGNTKLQTLTETTCARKNTACKKEIKLVTNIPQNREHVLKDTSLSDDLLATLAEPDEWLDSQVCSVERELKPLPISYNKSSATDSTKCATYPVVPQTKKRLSDKPACSSSDTKKLHLNDTPTFEDSDEELNEDELLEVLDAIETQISNSQKQSSQGGSQPLSQSTSDGKCSQKCSAQEIERKKLEAMKRRTNRLKSSQMV